MQVLKTVIRAGEEKEAGRGDDAFWESALDLLIFNTVDLCRLAYGDVSLRRIYDIVQTAAKFSNDQGKQEEGSNEQTAFEQAFELAKESVQNKTTAWRESLSDQDLEWMLRKGSFDNAVLENVPDAQLLTFVGQFFYDTYQNLASKTRSIIDFSFSSFLYRLLLEPAYSLFGKSESTFTPEDCLNGKIILLNLPVKLYNKVGRDCQILFKMYGSGQWSGAT